MRLLLRSCTLTYFNVKKSYQINMNYYYYCFPSLRWVYINIRKLELTKKYLKKNKILVRYETTFKK